MAPQVSQREVYGPPGCSTLAELRAAVPFDAEARQLAAGAADMDILLGQLQAAKLDVDAIRLLAYALPIRQAVWWGLLCTWHGLDGSPDAEQNMAVQAASRWVLEPAHAQQHTAQAVAQARPLQQAADCCVRAAGLAGHVERPDNVFNTGDVPGAARMVLAAVCLAYSERLNRQGRVTYRQLARLGSLVKEGKLLWTD
jgi:hypothetical protein